MSFFSTSSSLDLSILDFDLDDEPEPHPFSIILKKKHKKKHKKKRTKKKKFMRRLKHDLPPRTADLAEWEGADAALPVPTPEPTPVSTPVPGPSPARASYKPPPPFPSPDDDELEYEDILSDEEFLRILAEEDEEDLLLEVKDEGPEPVGILSILMKRRRAKAVEEKRPQPPPPPPPPTSAEEESTVSEEVSLPAVREQKPKPPKYISCKFNKPGPGQYEYYPSIGYVGHDPTRKRAPDFSFGRRTKIPEKKSIGPGPKYNIRNFTMKGKDKPISHQFGKRKPPPPIEITPGPADYKDQTMYLAKRSRSAYLYGRREDIKKFQTPGSIGELMYMGNERPAACLLGKPKAPKPYNFPSPLSYAPVKPDVYLTRGPSFTMGYNRKPGKTDADMFPTVGTYSPNYDYFKKKRDIVIATSNGSCVRIPMDLPEKKERPKDK